MISPDMLEIEPQQLADALRRGERVYLLDVRNDWEHQLARLPDQALIPLHELPARLDEVRAERTAQVVCYCHHGVRSLSTAAIRPQEGVDHSPPPCGPVHPLHRRVA